MLFIILALYRAHGRPRATIYAQHDFVLSPIRIRADERHDISATALSPPLKLSLGWWLAAGGHAHLSLAADFDYRISVFCEHVRWWFIYWLHRWMPAICMPLPFRLCLSASRTKLELWWWWRRRSFSLFPNKMQLPHFNMHVPRYNRLIGHHSSR